MATSKKSKSDKSAEKASAPASATRIVNVLKELATASGELRRKVPSGPALSSDDRRASGGKFRTGEAEILGQVLDVVDARPALFSALAAHDGGTDPAIVETAAARDALARKVAADEAVAAAELYVKALRDYALTAGEEVRALTTAAYAIIRANAAVDASLRDEAAGPIAYYRDNARAKSAKPKG
jgi:hypothetical protein